MKPETKRNSEKLTDFEEALKLKISRKTSKKKLTII
jgi:hypothetical protein